MTHELTTLAHDLQDRMNLLVEEVERLQEENERLRRENEELREEAALRRLLRSVASPAVGAAEGAPAPQPLLSRDAIVFYRHLPDRFDVIDFFERAEERGVESGAARAYMQLFFGEEMLAYEGARIRKTSAAARSRHAVPSAAGRSGAPRFGGDVGKGDGSGSRS